MKAVLKYPGAKNRLATWICGYIPGIMICFKDGIRFRHKPEQRVDG